MKYEQVELDLNVEEIKQKKVEEEQEPTEYETLLRFYGINEDLKNVKPLLDKESLNLLEKNLNKHLQLKSNYGKL